jgi:hypothetical protein
MRQTLLLTAQAAFHLESGSFSPLQARVHTGFFEVLLSRAFVEKTEKRDRDIKLVTNLKLKGDHVGFREKTQKEIED